MGCDKCSSSSSSSCNHCSSSSSSSSSSCSSSSSNSQENSGKNACSKDEIVGSHKSSSSSSSDCENAKKENVILPPEEWKKYLKGCKKATNVCRRTCHSWKGKTCSEVFCCHRRSVCNVRSQITYGIQAIEQDIITYDEQRSGCGFFIKNGFIVTSAQLVLMGSYSNDAVTLGRYTDGELYVSDSLTKVNRIFVEVQNGKGKVIVYEADLFAVDGAGDIALLSIDPCKDWNKGLNVKKLRKQPYLKWGNSRTYTPGNRAYLVGNIAGANSIGAAETSVVENRYAADTGLSIPETMLLQDNFGPGAVGSPILDVNGNVVGMLTGNQGSNDFSFGPTQFFMTTVICHMLGACRNARRIAQGKKCKIDRHIQTVADPLGSYFRYIKAYLGLHLSPVTTFTLVTEIGLDGFENCSILNEYINSDLKCKTLIGMQVDLVEGEDLDCSPDTSIGPPSPLLGVVSRGDIVTHLNGVPLGNYSNQVAPSLIEWTSLPGKKIYVFYLKQSENFSTLHAFGATAAAYPVNLPVFPGTLDYPNYWGVLSYQASQPNQVNQEIKKAIAQPSTIKAKKSEPIGVNPVLKVVSKVQAPPKVASKESAALSAAIKPNIISIKPSLKEEGLSVLDLIQRETKVV